MSTISTSMRRWGNSVGLRIPKRLVDKYDLNDGRLVSVSEDGAGGITIKRIAHDDSLKALLGRITKDNMHEHIEWGAPVGKEVW